MTQRDAIRERRRKKQQQQRMVAIMIVAGIALIAVAIIMVPTIMRNFQTVGEFTNPEINPRTMANGNTMGDPNADWQGYYSAVTELLNATPPEDFYPAINQLDALIQSMQVAP